MASCEGDIPGLATMYIQHKLSGKIPFFTDLVNISQSGSIKAWHCGQGPESLADSSVEYCEHPTMKSGLGTSVQYTMKRDNLNMAKLSEGSGEYKLFNVKGHSVEVDRELAGTQTDIVFDKDIDEILDVIVEEGIEHHYSIIHEDLTEVLIEWCKWSNVKYIK
jgi:L-fucose isomerase-like protein